MHKQTLILNKLGQRVKLDYNSEQPFCKIISCEVQSEQMDDLNKDPVVLIYETTGRWGQTGGLGNVLGVRERIVDISQGKEVFFYLNPSKETKNEVQKIKVILKVETLDKLDTEIPTANFDKHLEDPRNVKILFSAPFGQGKTTFLNYFFDERLDEYFVVRLFPVNYAVASNKDIFKYIKADILFQLLESTEIQFEEVFQKYGKTFLDYFKKNAEKVLGPLLLILSDVDHSAPIKLWELLTKEKDKYLQFHDEQQINEVDIASSFINDLISTEGSIFEENLYTELIIKLLERHKSENPDKETILVIDDLDRMDPEHVFRILNIFSAHYDRVGQGLDKGSNKFDFNRIILVCDLDNIQKMYAYRYGPDVHFNGYIGKYYSTQPFKYSNADVLDQLLQNIDNSRRIPEIDKHPYYEFFYYLMKAFIKAKQYTLRDLLKVRIAGLKDQIAFLKNNETPETSLLARLSTSIGLAAMVSISSKQILSKQIEALEENDFDPVFISRKLQGYCDLLIAGQSGKLKNSVNYTHKEENFVQDLSIDTDDDGCIKISGSAKFVLPRGAGMSPYQYTFNEFRKFMIENVKLLPI